MRTNPSTTARRRPWWSGRTAVIGIPYLWLLVFFLLPFLIVAKISVSEMETVSVKDLLTVKEGVLQLSLKFSNYVFITQDDLYFRAYVASLKYAAITTLLCLAIGYPFAYFMARARPTAQPLLLTYRSASPVPPDVVIFSRCTPAGSQRYM